MLMTLKLYLFYSNIKTHVAESLSLSSSICRSYDLSNVHVKSFFLHCIQSSQMSNGTVERSSFNTLRLG